MKKHLANLSYIFLSILLGGLFAVFSHRIFLNSDLNQFQRLGDIFCTEIQTHIQVGGYRKATELLETKFRQEHLKGSTFFLADGNKTYYQGKLQKSSYHRVDCKIDGKKGVDVHFLFFSKYLTANTRMWFLYLGILFSSLLLLAYRKVMSVTENYISRIIGFSLIENLKMTGAGEKKNFTSGFIERLIDLNGHIFQKVRSDMSSLKSEIEEKSRALAKSESEKMRLLTEKSKNEEFIRHVDQVRHDIAGPLNSIKAIRPEHLLNPTLGPEMLSSVTERMGQILSGLNHLKGEYKIDHISEVDLEKLLLEIIGEKEIILGSTSKIKFSLNLNSNGKGSSIVIDSGFLKRTVSNILDNSIEAIGSKNGQVKVTLESKKNGVFIKFTDNGVGIEKELLPKLFKQGATFGKKSGQGLGLFTAKEFVSRNNGAIIIRSKKNWGTQIVLTLPRKQNMQTVPIVSEGDVHNLAIMS